MQRYLFLLGATLLASCSREIQIDDFVFPTVPQQAAIFCVLTPGDSIFTTLRTVESINQQSASTTRPVDGARIMLFDQTTNRQTVLKALRQSGLYGCDQQQMAIQAGHRYQLLAILLNQDTLRANCQLPQQAAHIDSVAFGEPYKDILSSRRRVTLSWPDVSSFDKPYRYFVVSQSIFTNRILVDTYFDQQFITQAGQRLYFNNDTFDSKTPNTYYVITAEPALFTFYAFAAQMRKSSGSKPSDFFGAYTGITPTFTNIQNGYGIFGGYLKTQRTITFP